ncbi:MAG: hypothetical protein ACLGHJ_00270 [Gammaproteobacteria bacterium]
MQDQATAETPRSPRWIYYSLLVSVVAAIVLYLPGITGPFIHDDTGQITANPDVLITEITVENLVRSTSHYPSRPLPMMSFALNHASCGLETSCYKSTNIFIHAATGLALFIFLTVLAKAGRRRRLFETPAWLPLVVTALWLLHPLNVSTTLYVVQRMTQLSILFSLLFLACYLQARFLSGNIATRTGWYVAAAGSLLLGLWSKENAALALLLAGLLELLLLSPQQRQRLAHPRITGWVIAALAFAALAWLALYPTTFIARSYLQRDFLPVERLLGEARILWYYASEVLWPDASRMSFFLDFIPLSRSLLDPWTTLPAVLGWYVLCGAALASLLRGPSLWGFGVLFFLVSHLIESTLIGLVPAYEHRNYGAAIGLILAGCALLYPVLRTTWPRAMVTVAALLFCSLQLIARVDTWSSETAFASQLQQPQFSASYNGTLSYAAYYDQQADQLTDSPAMARLFRQKSLVGFRHAATLSTQPYAALSFLVLKAPTAEEREARWQELFSVAARKPATYDALNWANVMASCLLLPQCPVSRDNFARYMDILLAQPKTPTVLRNKLRRTAGTFFTKVYGAPEKGIALARLAAASGQPDARESLIKNLAFAGHIDEAQREYEALARDYALDPKRRERIEWEIANPGAPASW